VWFVSAACQVFEEGIELCNTKSVKKGIARLAEEGYMTNHVEDVVAFIRLCGDRLSPREVCTGVLVHGDAVI
jgi:hypothetical protein